MKILAINPPQIYCKGETPRIVFPIGLAYVVSILKKSNYQIDVLDCIGEYPYLKEYSREYNLLGFGIKTLKKNLIKKKPNIVLISCPISNQHSLVVKISKIVKRYTNAKIIVGGAHASAMPQSLINENTIDFIVIGEGELTISNLLKSLNQKRKIKKIPGLAFKENKKTQINPPFDFISNIDNIPFPAYELFPYENYVTSNYKHTLLNSKKRIAEIITSRGCPFECSFCASKSVTSKKWRGRTPENVLKEIEYLKNNYKIEEIHFLDDNISLDTKRFKKLCNLMRNNNISWTIPNGISMKTIDKETIKLMKQSGCYAIFFPVETANTFINKKHIPKNPPPKTIKELIRYSHKKGLYNVGFFLLGFWEEDKKSIEKTIKFACDLKLDEAHFSILTPLPGSQYYKTYAKDFTSFRDLSAKKATIDTKHLNRKELESLRDKAYIVFEFNKFFDRPLSYLNISQLSRILRYMKYILAR